MTSNNTALTKENALEAIRQMPQNFAIEQLVEKLLFVAKTEEGIKDIETTKTVPQDELIWMAEEWRGK